MPEDVFFGMLRSEYDSSDTVPTAFDALAALTAEVLTHWNAGTLNGTGTMSILATALLQSTDGTLWTVGAQTGRWYRKPPGGRWHVANPPNASTYDPAWGDSLETARRNVTAALNKHLPSA